MAADTVADMTTPDRAERETAARVARLVPRAILQDGVDFEVTRNRASGWRRIGLMRRPRRFTVYPICTGALLEISKIIMTMDTIDANAGDNLFSVGVRSIVDSKNRMLDILAIAILNRKSTWRTRIQTWRIRRFLDANLDAHELLRLVGLVVDQMGVADFLASSVSIRRLNLIETGKVGETAAAAKVGS